MHPTDLTTFRFTAYDFDESTATASLHYALDDRYRFTETVHFPGADLPLDPARRAALPRVLRHLHLVAGVSYYKAAVPPQIRVETGPLDADSADFLQQVYTHGLGEFAYRNGLDLRGRIRFPVAPPSPALPHQGGGGSALAPPWQPPPGLIVPIGGGKDSVVALEMLRASLPPGGGGSGRGGHLRLFSVGKPAAIAAVAECSGFPHIVVTRKLDPRLFELNAQGAYNGHVPITAIIAFILAAGAVLYHFDTVVMANERSANSGNLRQGDWEVNHQYSKSLAFEQAVQRQFARLLPGFRYFSLLRGLSELDIARRFAHHSAYHSVFSSCNANYKIHTKSGHQGRWCLNCPKCRFVFLSLAPFMPKLKLLSVFGADLLNDPAQQAGFDALIGLGTHKPFECVGEVGESQAAFYLLSQRPDWQDAVLVKRFRDTVLPTLDHPQALVDAALTPVAASTIPAEFAGLSDDAHYRTST